MRRKFNIDKQVAGNPTAPTASPMARDAQATAGWDPAGISKQRCPLFRAMVPLPSQATHSDCVTPSPPQSVQAIGAARKDGNQPSEGRTYPDPLQLSQEVSTSLEPEPSHTEQYSVRVTCSSTRPPRNCSSSVM